MSDHAVNAEHLDAARGSERALWPGDLTTVQTPFGEFAAVDDGEITRIRNIRYARAERFAPPIPVEPDPHEASARQYQRLGCPQPPASSDVLFGGPLRGVDLDEDCLRLSLTRPSDWTGEPLPVMVWVHGGSYVSGAGDLGGYDPRALVLEQRVMVVTVTYRLGVLGFLGDGEPGGRPAEPRPARHHRGAAVGAGAHRRVRRRPRAGDRLRESSGADAIAHLLAVSGARGLVTRAILQSAPFGIRERRGKLQERMRRAAGPLAPDAALDELFAAQARAARAAAGFGLRSGMPFSPQYGHAPLPPEREVAAGWRRQAPGLDVLVCSTTRGGGLLPRARAEAQVTGGEAGDRARDPLRTRPRGDRRRLHLGRPAVRPAAGADPARGCRSPDSMDGPRAAASARPTRSTSRCCSRIRPRGLPAPLLAPHGAESLVEAGAPLRAAWGEFAAPDGSPRRGSAWARVAWRPAGALSRSPVQRCDITSARSALRATHSWLGMSASRLATSSRTRSGCDTPRSWT